MIQRGRAHELKPATGVYKLSEEAYQRAQNKVAAEDVERRKAESNQNG